VNILHTQSPIENQRIGEDFMSYCPKCGHKVDETMTFCPNCGASLKTAANQGAPPPVYSVQNRNEKQEKQEKGEKHEKGQGGMVGWLIAGLILV
jgi:uncharacterized membrane protein YvbJ